MNPLPSRTGLLLGRICVYIQHALLSSLASKLIVALIPNLLGALLAIFPYVVLLIVFQCIKINASDFDREMMRSKYSNEPDYWQNEWMRKSRSDARIPKDAWRIVQTTSIFAVFTGLLFTYTYSYNRTYYPNPNQGPGDLAILWVYVTFLLGPFFGYTVPFASKPRPEVFYGPNGDDDPDGPAGLGARVRPPTPVLTGGNHFPDEKQRY